MFKNFLSKNIWKIEAIIAITTAILEWFLFVIMLYLNNNYNTPHFSKSAFIWGILWSIWFLFCAYKWKFNQFYSWYIWTSAYEYQLKLEFKLQNLIYNIKQIINKLKF